ncbi:DNA ligase [Duganella sp. FT27W]|uniref:ATP-dependent DNA ligase n=1 Tax=Duganella sp. FT27W TaxID=2654636 RepID=UPI00186B87D3|nr:DNA ligase [Duganella sp. FT27W]
MNTDEVFGLIEAIANTPGKNDKLAMLKKCSSSATLKRVLKMANDPLISYGIRKVPARTALRDTGELFNDRTWEILDSMSNRTLTGSAMQSAIAYEIDRLSLYSAELFKRIMLKDMRAGFAEESTNKTWPGLLPDFPYMRCSLPKHAKMADWDWAAGVFSQEKADGMFTNVNHEVTGAVFMYSRQGSMFPMESFGELVDAIRLTLAPGTQTHGEMLVMRDGAVLAREIGNGILNSVLQGGQFGPSEKPIFMAWDQIPLASVVPKGSFETPYRDRLRVLLGQITAAHSPVIKLVPTRLVRSLKEAYAHYAELLAKGKEGTIVKNPVAIWRDGTSKDQVKLKLEFELDMEVTAVVLGKANKKTAGRPGSLTCSTAGGMLVTDVAIKGEAMRDDVEANPEKYVGAIMPVTANMILRPSQSNPLHSLFLPRFSQSTPRMDKTVADSLERAFEIEDAAKEGAAINEEMKAAA